MRTGTTCHICSRSTRRCTGPTRRAASKGRDTRPTSRRRPARTRVRCRSSPTSTAQWASPTTATATRRRGICLRPRTFPPGYARNGTWFRFFAAKAAGSYGVGWPPGSAVFQYPNENRASTIWYHDHALGMTRLNVYAGPAGFYIVRGGPAGDDAVLDSRSTSKAVLPGPAPAADDPPNKTYYEIPIAIQDRSFNERRLALLPRLTRVLRRRHRRRSGLHPGHRPVADLESRVLREHDHGQRQHLAVPDRRAAPLPLPLPERLPVALPHPRLQRHPRRRGLADRQRGRLPRGARSISPRRTATAS